MSKAPRPTPIIGSSCYRGTSVSPRLPAYCQALQFAPTATAFVAELRERLREVAQRVDATYPDNTELTIDAGGHAASQTSPGATDSGRPRTRSKPCSKSGCPSGTSSISSRMCTIGWAIPGILARLLGPIPNSPIPFCAIFSPSLAMPVSSGPPKRHAIPMGRLAARSCDGLTTSILRPPSWRPPCAM